MKLHLAIITYRSKYYLCFSFFLTWGCKINRRGLKKNMKEGNWQAAKSSHYWLFICSLMFMFLYWYQSLGLSSASTGMFYNGAGDLVLHFIATCNSQLTDILAEQHNQVQLGQAEYVPCARSFTVQFYRLHTNLSRQNISVKIHFLEEDGRSN